MASKKKKQKKAKLAKIVEENIKLKKLDEEKNKFLAIIAHDLRSPFQGLLSTTELLLEDVKLTLEEKKNLTKELKNSAKNLYGLLENLLEWAKLQQKEMNFKLEKFSLNHLVSECVELAKGTTLIKGIKLENKIPKNIEAYTDMHMLKSVVRNLISNAVKFTNKNGEINISAKITGIYVEVSVKDTGIGMKEEFIKNLFNISEKTSRKGTDGEPSSGLGLLLCKEFVEKNGGKIWVDSEEGKGSTFTFTTIKAV